MKGINSVVIVGNLGNDPEVKFTQGGMAIASLSVATTSSRKDKDGQWQDTTQWHRVKLFGKTAEVAGEYLKKGSPIAVQGRIEYGSYEKDGVKVYTTDIIADSMQMPGGKSDGESRPQRERPQAPAPADDFAPDSDIPF